MQAQSYKCLFHLMQVELDVQILIFTLVGLYTCEKLLVHKCFQNLHFASLYLKRSPFLTPN